MHSPEVEVFYTVLGSEDVSGPITCIQALNKASVCEPGLGLKGEDIIIYIVP